MTAAVAFVPARAGSERVPGKNIRPLAGHPLIAYTIAAARESGRFDAVMVSTDSEETAEIARRYGAEVPGLRPESLATTTTPDNEWVRHTLGVLGEAGRRFELFSILRPSSPFRGADAIGRAFDQLVQSQPPADSIRAVELCRQHPGKMWVVEGEQMRPLLEQPAGVPFHSSQYQSLPRVYVQNSSLEVAWTRVAEEGGGIAGERVLPFFTTETEGFSVDYEDDWQLAERWLDTGHATLPSIEPAPRVAEEAR
jgi:CMP-N,N'-diacetyllegionaminic acid synthase